MDEQGARLTLKQDQRYETCKATLEGRMSDEQAAQAAPLRHSLGSIRQAS